MGIICLSVSVITYTYYRPKYVHSVSENHHVLSVIRLLFRAQILPKRRVQNFILLSVVLNELTWNQGKKYWRWLKKFNVNPHISEYLLYLLYAHIAHHSLKFLYFDQPFFLNLANSFTLDLEICTLGEWRLSQRNLGTSMNMRQRSDIWENLLVT